MKHYAIIVAGGKGSRFDTSKPKQFQTLAGKPMLFFSIEAFFNSVNDIEVILVLPEDYAGYWEELCKQHQFSFPCKVCLGGTERYFSVKNALKFIGKEGLVAIHDAARPLIRIQLIKACYHVAASSGAAVPVIPVRDSMGYIIEKEFIQPFPRKDLVAVQTPQCFRAEILHQAYRQAYTPDFTDDASVVHAAGFSIAMVEGESSNIKITFPDDIRWAASLLEEHGFN